MRKEDIDYNLNNIKVWAQSIGKYGEDNDKEMGKAILVELDTLKDNLRDLWKQNHVKK